MVRAFIEPPALFSILSMAFTDRLLIHSEVQISSGLGVLAHADIVTVARVNNEVRIIFVMNRYNPRRCGIQTLITLLNQ